MSAYPRKDKYTEELFVAQDKVKPILEVRETEKPASLGTYNNQSYVVALFLYEQLLASSYTYLQLQCWIGNLNTTFPLRAVEPNVLTNRSTLGFTFENDNFPVVSDIFDMKTWYSQWRNRAAHLAPMTTRSEFLKDITKHTKNVILVQYDYKTKTDTVRCNFTWDTRDLVKHFSKFYPLLSVSRRVCLIASVPVLAEEVENIILGDIGIQNTLIIINDWRGMKSGKIAMKHPMCIEGIRSSNGQLQPSTAVMKDAEKYADKYLGGFGEYVSISARFELVSQKYWKWSIIQRRTEITAAIKELIHKVEDIKKYESIKRVYLAYDYGKLGSYSFQKQKFYNSSDLLVKFQEDLYDGRMSYREYNRSQMEFKFHHKGYVAVVQMAIAAKGKCMITLGWGHCVRFVRHLYMMYHQPPFCLKNQ